MTGNALAMMPSTPKRRRSEHEEDHRKHGQKRGGKAAQLRDDEIVIERREEPARSGDGRLDAAAGEGRGRELLGRSNLLEDQVASSSTPA